MNKAANTYWTDASLTAPALTAPVEIPLDIIATGAEARRRGPLLPSWVIFGMILLATFALCISVTMRTHASMRAAKQQYHQLSTDVEQMRDANAALEREVERLRTDPRTIEATARERLNMVRADEVVVTVE